MNELSDEELMAMYQNGSAAAFQILYESHSSKVYQYLKKRVRREEKVAEIFQNSFLKIHRSKHLYNRTLPLLPWLFTVTRTVLLDELKKDKNFKYNDNFDIDTAPAKVIQDTDQLAEVSQFIKALPEIQRKAVELRYVDEKSFAEMAEILKTTPVNARQILSRGVKRLKQLITERDPL